MRYLLAALALVAVACSEPPEPEGNNDYERGYQAGYERALEDVAGCSDTADPGKLADCLATRAIVLPGEVSDTYRDGIRLTGLLIESEMLVRYR